jgi:hypothetical protein
LLECVPNVSEGRDADVLAMLVAACGASLLDVHRDADHHRSVFTLAGHEPVVAVGAVRDLARAVRERVDLRAHAGIHPRLGARVVPFVALDHGPGEMAAAVDAARDFADWVAGGSGCRCSSTTGPTRRGACPTPGNAFVRRLTADRRRPTAARRRRRRRGSTRRGELLARHADVAVARAIAAACASATADCAGCAPSGSTSPPRSAPRCR